MRLLSVLCFLFTLSCKQKTFFSNDQREPEADTWGSVTPPLTNPDNIRYPNSGRDSCAGTNGISFASIPQSYSNFTSLPRARVKGVAIDPSGNLFVATEMGLSISANGGSSFITRTTAHGLANNHVLSVFISANGTIYAITEKNIIETGERVSSVSISKDGGQSFTKHRLPGLGNAISLHVSSSEIIYVGMDTGLFVSKNNGQSFEKKEPVQSPASRAVGAIHKASNGLLYVATSAGLGISSDDGDTFDIKNVSSGLGSIKISDIYYKSNSNTLYVLNNAGLSVSTDGGETFSHKGSESGLSHSDIWPFRTLSVDNGPNVVITSSKGFFVSSDNGNTFSFKEATGHYFYSAAVGSNSYYLGSSYGLLVLSNNLQDLYQIPSHNNYTGWTLRGRNHVAILKSGEIAYTASGLKVSDDRGRTFDEKDFARLNLLNTRVYSYGNLLYLTGNGNGLQNNNHNKATIAWSMDKGNNFTSVIIDHSRSHPPQILHLFVSSDNTIYVSTTRGLYISRDNAANFEIKNVSNGLADDKVSMVAEDAQGLVYAATKAGLSISRNKGASFTNETVDYAIPINQISNLNTLSVDAIAIDKQGWIYIANSFAFRVSKDGGKTFSKLNLRGVGNSIFIDSLGYIYVGTAGGLALSSDNGQSFCLLNAANSFLSGDYITSIEVTDAGLIYVSTDGGLSIGQRL